MVEYYQVSEPDGFLLVDAGGTVKRLIIQSEAQMAEQLDLARRFHAPSPIVEALASHRQIGYFYESPADYLGNEAFPWHEFMLDTYKVDSTQTWFIGISDDPVLDVDYHADTSCYHRFLKSFLQEDAL